jgi:hypothetical protein
MAVTDSDIAQSGRGAAFGCAYHREQEPPPQLRKDGTALIRRDKASPVPGPPPLKECARMLPERPSAGEGLLPISE